MSNELNNIISRNTDGVCEGVAIGGDRFPGTLFLDHLLRYEGGREGAVMQVYAYNGEHGCSSDPCCFSFARFLLFVLFVCFILSIHSCTQVYVSPCLFVVCIPVCLFTSLTSLWSLWSHLISVCLYLLLSLCIVFICSILLSLALSLFCYFFVHNHQV